MSEPNADPLIALLLDSLIENEEPKAAAHIGDSEAAMSLPELRAAVLSATGPGVEPQRAFSGFVRRFAAMFDLTTEAAEAILGRAAAPLSKEWQQVKTMHVLHFKPGKALRGAHAGLVRVLPGTMFPSHTHIGTETTLFLSGMARDDVSGTLHLPGDVVRLGPQSVHHATALPPHECIFAALFEGGMIDFHQGEPEAHHSHD